LSVNFWKLIGNFPEIFGIDLLQDWDEKQSIRVWGDLDSDPESFCAVLTLHTTALLVGAG